MPKQLHIHFIGIYGKGVNKAYRFWYALSLLLNHKVKLTASEIKRREDLPQVEIYTPDALNLLSSRKIDLVIYAPVIRNLNTSEYSLVQARGIPAVDFADFLRYLFDIYIESHEIIDMEYLDSKAPDIIKGVFKNIPADAVRKAVYKSDIFPLLKLKKSPKVIGITGTDGKTSTSYFLYNLLKGHYSVGTYITTGKYTYLKDRNKQIVKHIDSHLTSPDGDLVYKMVKEWGEEGVEYVILEVSSHSLTQLRLAGLKFDAVYCTNITRDHLDYYSYDILRYRHAKSLIYRNHLKEGGVGFINLSDPSWELLMTKMPKNTRIVGLTFDPEKKPRFRQGVKTIPLKVTDKNIIISNQKFSMPAKIFGVFRQNLAAAAAIYAQLTNKPIDIQIWNNMSTPPGRLEIFKTEPYTILIDYSHTPAGMEKLKQFILNDFKPSGRVISVFGVAGYIRDKGKRPILMQKLLEFSDVIILVPQDNMKEDVRDINKDLLAGVSLVEKRTLTMFNIQIEYMVTQNGNEVLAVLDNTPYARLIGFTLAVNIAQPNDLVVSYKGHEYTIIIGNQEYRWNDKQIFKFLTEYFEADPQAEFVIN